MYLSALWSKAAAAAHSSHIAELRGKTIEIFIRIHALSLLCGKNLLVILPENQSIELQWQNPTDNTRTNSAWGIHPMNLPIKLVELVEPEWKRILIPNSPVHKSSI